MKKKLIACLTALILALSIPGAIASAYSTLPLDVGNHNRYSGGSHRSSGGHHYSSGSSIRRSSGSASTIEIIAAVITLLILIIYAIYDTCSRKNEKLKNAPNCFNLQITGEMLKTDPDFDFREFLKFAENTFIELQNAWSARDWERVRTLEGEALFEHHNTQLQEYIRLGRINKVEDIEIKESYLHEYVIERDHEYLTVYLDTKMLDYIIDERTDKVIMGSNKNKYNMRYLMTFMRTKNTTENGSKICPHCGADVETGSSGVCPFCGSVIHADSYGWVLSDLESIDKDSIISDGGIINK